MAALALALFVLYASPAFGVRALVRFRSTGFKGISGRPGSPGWLGGVLFVAAVGLVLVASVLGLAGALAMLP